MSSRMQWVLPRLKYGLPVLVLLLLVYMFAGSSDLPQTAAVRPRRLPPPVAAPAPNRQQQQQQQHNANIFVPDAFSSSVHYYVGRTGRAAGGHLLATNASQPQPPFDFLLATNSCALPRPLAPRMIIYVASGPSRAASIYRSVLRRTWISQARQHRVHVVFVVGLPHPRVLPDLDNEQNMADFIDVVEESDKYGDILQPSFVDSLVQLNYCLLDWEHQTFKYYAELSYHAAHCSHVPLFVSTEEDAILFLDRLFASYIDTPRGRQQLVGKSMLCSMIFEEFTNPAIREKESRYYVGEHQWPKDNLGHYCSGNFQLLTAKAVSAMQRAVAKVGLDFYTSFRPSDVPTGIIATAAGVRIKQLPVLFHAYPPTPDVCSPQYVGQHGLRPEYEAFKLWQLRQSCCADGNSSTFARDSDNKPLCFDAVEFPPKDDKGVAFLSVIANRYEDLRDEVYAPKKHSAPEKAASVTATADGVTDAAAAEQQPSVLSDQLLQDLGLDKPTHQ